MNEHNSDSLFCHLRISLKFQFFHSGKWMCSLCTVKRGQNNNGEVFIIDEDETVNIVTTTSSNNNNISNPTIPVSGVMATGGPPTMVQLQRISQTRPGLE